MLASDFGGRAEPKKLIEILNGCVKKEFLAKKISKKLNTHFQGVTLGQRIKSISIDWEFKS